MTEYGPPNDSNSLEEELRKIESQQRIRESMSRWFGRLPNIVKPSEIYPVLESHRATFEEFLALELKPDRQILFLDQPAPDGKQYALVTESQPWGYLDSFKSKIAFSRFSGHLEAGWWIYDESQSYSSPLVDITITNNGFGLAGGGLTGRGTEIIWGNPGQFRNACVNKLLTARGK